MISAPPNKVQVEVLLTGPIHHLLLRNVFGERCDRGIIAVAPAMERITADVCSEGDLVTIMQALPSLE